MNSQHISTTIRFRKSVLLLCLLVISFSVSDRTLLAQATRKDELPELYLQTGHAGSVVSVDIDAAGKKILTGSQDGVAILWEVESGRQLRTYKVDGVASLHGAKFSPDGTKVLLASYSGSVIRLDAKTGQHLGSLKCSPGSLSVAEFSPNGSSVLIGPSDGSAILWNIGSGMPVWQSHKYARAAAFSHDSKMILVGGGYSGAAVLRDGKRLVELDPPPPPPEPNLIDDEVTSAAFSHDDSKIAIGSANGYVRLWDCSSGKLLQSSKTHDYWVTSIIFNKESTSILSGDSQGGLKVLNANTLKVRDILRQANLSLLEKPNGILDISLSQDGSKIFVALGHDSAILLDSISYRVIRTFSSSKTQAGMVAHSSDGSKIFVHPFLDKYRYSPIVSSPSGDVIATSSPEYFANDAPPNTVILWDSRSRRKLAELNGHSDFIEFVKFSANGQRVLTGSRDGTAVLWDASNGQSILTFRNPLFERGQFLEGGPVRPSMNSGTISPDGATILTVSSAAILWDAKTGKQLRKFDGHRAKNELDYRTSGDDVYSATFSPDGRKILTGGYDPTAILWDTATGEKLGEFKNGHASKILTSCFSPDGQSVLTGCDDGKVVLWDVQTRQKIRSFNRNAKTSFGLNKPFSVSFNHDGSLIIYNSGKLLVWDTATGDEVARLITLNDGRDWLVVTPEGLFDGKESARQKVSFRLGNGLDVAPVDRFFQDFYRPGLLQRIMKGERPKPEVEMVSLKSPPTLTITSPDKSKVSVDSDSIEIAVKAVNSGGGIQGPWLTHNGARVLATGQSSSVGDQLFRTFNVRLVSGENEFSVTAATGDGSRESEPAKITLKYSKPVEQSELYVLAIGVNDYKQESFNLKFAANDANAIGDLFKRRGSALYAKVHLTKLTNAEVTKSAISNSLAKIAATANPQDTLVVFLAGHGTMVGQRYYFITHDFVSNSDNTMNQDIRKQGLAAAELSDDLISVPALKRMLIFDTCQSGGAIGNALGSRNPFAFRGAVEKLGRMNGVHMIGATATTDEAQEVDELGHGVLTYALLAGLNAVDRGPLMDRPIRSSSPENVASVLDWFNYADGQVPRLTKKYFGQEQDVQTNTSGSAFPVLPLVDKE